MFAQIIANTLIRGAELGLLAVGVTMTFSVLRFANFAHGELALLGGYLSLFAVVALGLPLVPAILVGALLAGAIAVGCDRLLFRRLRRAPGLTLLIASLGLAIFLRYLVAAIWGVDAIGFPDSYSDSHRILGAYVTTTQLWIMATTVAAMIGFHVLMSYTRLGKALRALSDNRELAQARGIDIEAMTTKLWFIVGAYAGLGGALIGYETVLTPEMGYNIMLAVFAAAILGGIGNIYGALVGALVIALAENAVILLDWSPLFRTLGLLDASGALYVPTGYKLAIPLLILWLVLMFMPRGIFRGATGD